MGAISIIPWSHYGSSRNLPGQALISVTSCCVDGTNIYLELLHRKIAASTHPYRQHPSSLLIRARTEQSGSYTSYQPLHCQPTTYDMELGLDHHNIVNTKKTYVVTCCDCGAPRIVMPERCSICSHDRCGNCEVKEA